MRILHISNRVSPGAVTNLEEPARCGGRYGRWLLALCDLAAGRGKRRIATLEPFPVCLSGEHSG
jgi:hypothetical protein